MKQMTKIPLLLLVLLIGVAACGKDEPDVANLVYDADNDSTLEKLTTPVWRYYGDKPDDVTRIMYTYRQKGVYCLFPKTSAREQELQRLRLSS